MVSITSIKINDFYKYFLIRKLVYKYIYTRIYILHNVYTRSVTFYFKPTIYFLRQIILRIQKLKPLEYYETQL